MSLTYQNLAQYVYAMYNAPITVSWLYKANPDANVVFGIVRVGDYLIVVLRGSYTRLDWLRDVLVLDFNPPGNPRFKRVHSGFYSGTPEAIDIVLNYYKPGDKVIFIGHSLGAARAEILAEQFIAKTGKLPALLLMWAQPAPFKPSTMPTIQYPIVSYRNVFQGVEDEVTYSTDIVGYTHRTKFTDVSGAPHDPPLGLHHFDIYQKLTPDTLVT